MGNLLAQHDGQRRAGRTIPGSMVRSEWRAPRCAVAAAQRYGGRRRPPLHRQQHGHWRQRIPRRLRRVRPERIPVRRGRPTAARAPAETRRRAGTRAQHRRASQRAVHVRQPRRAHRPPGWRRRLGTRRRWRLPRKLWRADHERSAHQHRPGRGTPGRRHSRVRHPDQQCARSAPVVRRPRQTRAGRVAARTHLAPRRAAQRPGSARVPGAPDICAQPRRAMH